jgi:thimet oligopeptidase
VIARDLLSGFGDGLMDPGVALQYRTEVLERGGSRDARDLVEAFLGRASSFDAYRGWLAGD